MALTVSQFVDSVLGIASDTTSKPLPDMVDWIQTNFWIPELNAPIVLYPPQIAALREARRTDSDGNFVYSTILWSWIKKSAKSTILAAWCDYIATHTPYSSIRLVANDLKQADSRVAYYLRRAVEKRSDIQINRYKVIYPNGATVEAVPIDPRGEAGGNDDLLVFSELWAWKHEAAQRMWTELTLSPGKFGKAQRLIDTYAGFIGESPLLENLYQQGVKNGQQLDLSYDEHDLRDFEVYANESAGLLAVWNTRPLFPWQAPEYYAEESIMLAPAEYERIHRNQWGMSSQAFVPFEWWQACGIGVPPREPHEQIVLALDAAVSGDCFAIVGVSRREDTVAVRYVNVWTPPLGGKLDFAEPEAELRRLVSQYPIACIAYDEYQLHDMATRLQTELSVWFNPFGQGQPRLIADKQLYDFIRDRRITHSNEPMLAEHIRNANAKMEGERLRIIKRADNSKVDAAVALSMVLAQALELNL